MLKKNSSTQTKKNPKSDKNPKTKASGTNAFFQSKNPLLRVVGLLIPTIKGEDNFSQNLELAKSDLIFQDAALVQALSFGTARFYHRLEFIKNRLMRKKLSAKDADLNALLLIGMFQLQDQATPDYAVVDKCVSATSDLNKDWAKGLINAVLRNFIRKFRDDLVAGNFAKISQESIDKDILEFSHPYWIIENLRKNYPTNFAEILNANNRQAPLVLRTNSQKISRDDYLQLLQESQIQAKAGVLPNSIYLEKPTSVEQLPNFQQGFASLQDEAGQLLPYLFDLKNGQNLQTENVQTQNLTDAGKSPAEENQKTESQKSENLEFSILDACAAPGGKTCAILETNDTIKLMALDKDSKRLEKVDENLRRLNLQDRAQIAQADFLQLPKELADAKFDRILLDVPCSASGIIRRHPDIKLMRKKADLKKFVEQELQMLEIAKNLLKKNGTLIYATCSIFFEENANLIARFLQKNPHFEVDTNLAELKKSMALKDFLDKANISQYGIQFLPNTNFNDGFFYAPLKFK